MGTDKTSGCGGTCVHMLPLFRMAPLLGTVLYLSTVYVCRAFGPGASTLSRDPRTCNLDGEARFATCRAFCSTLAIHTYAAACESLPADTLRLCCVALLPSLTRSAAHSTATQAYHEWTLNRLATSSVKAACGHGSFPYGCLWYLSWYLESFRGLLSYHCAAATGYCALQTWLLRSRCAPGCSLSAAFCPAGRAAALVSPFARRRHDNSLSRYIQPSHCIRPQC